MRKVLLCEDTFMMRETAVVLYPGSWINFVNMQHWLVADIDIAFSLVADDDVIKWKTFPRYWPWVRGFHRSPGDSPHKGQWRGTLTFSLISAWINGWANNRDTGDLRRHRTHFDVTVTHSWSRCCQGGNSYYKFKIIVLEYSKNPLIFFLYIFIFLIFRAQYIAGIVTFTRCFDRG